MEFITKTKFAAICKVNVRTLNTWIKNGRIDATGDLITVNDAYVFLNRHGMTTEATIMNILIG